MHKNKKAFTLIELLIVVAIVGILSSVILVSLNNARDKARKANVVTAARNIQAILMICQSNYSRDVNNRFLAGCDEANPRESCEVGEIPIQGLPVCTDVSTSWVWPDFSLNGYEYVNSAFSDDDSDHFYFELHKDGESLSLCCYEKGCSDSQYVLDGRACFWKIIIPRPPRR